MQRAATEDGFPVNIKNCVGHADLRLRLATRIEALKAARPAAIFYEIAEAVRPSVFVLTHDERPNWQKGQVGDAGCRYCLIRDKS